MPSLSVFYEIVSLCKLPAERYFHPEAAEKRSTGERERVNLKLTVCPDSYLPIVEGAIDAAIKLGETKND